MVEAEQGPIPFLPDFFGSVEKFVFCTSESTDFDMLYLPGKSILGTVFNHSVIARLAQQNRSPDRTCIFQDLFFSIHACLNPSPGAAACTVFFMINPETGLIVEAIRIHGTAFFNIKLSDERALPRSIVIVVSYDIGVYLQNTNRTVRYLPVIHLDHRRGKYRAGHHFRMFFKIHGCDASTHGMREQIIFSCFGERLYYLIHQCFHIGNIFIEISYANTGISVRKITPACTVTSQLYEEYGISFLIEAPRRLMVFPKEWIMTIDAFSSGLTAA